MLQCEPDVRNGNGTGAERDPTGKKEMKKEVKEEKVAVQEEAEPEPVLRTRNLMEERISRSTVRTMRGRAESTRRREEGLKKERSELLERTRSTSNTSRKRKRSMAAPMFGSGATRLMIKSSVSDSCLDNSLMEMMETSPTVQPANKKHREKTPSPAPEGTPGPVSPRTMPRKASNVPEEFLRLPSISPGPRVYQDRELDNEVFENGLLPDPPAVLGPTELQLDNLMDTIGWQFKGEVKGENLRLVRARLQGTWLAIMHNAPEYSQVRVVANILEHGREMVGEGWRRSPVTGAWDLPLRRAPEVMLPNEMRSSRGIMEAAMRIVTARVRTPPPVETDRQRFREDAWEIVNSTRRRMASAEPNYNAVPPPPELTGTGEREEGEGEERKEDDEEGKKMKPEEEKEKEKEKERMPEEADGEARARYWDNHIRRYGEIYGEEPGREDEDPPIPTDEEFAQYRNPVQTKSLTHFGFRRKRAPAPATGEEDKKEDPPATKKGRHPAMRELGPRRPTAGNPGFLRRPAEQEREERVERDEEERERARERERDRETREARDAQQRRPGLCQPRPNLEVMVEATMVRRDDGEEGDDEVNEEILNLIRNLALNRRQQEAILRRGGAEEAEMERREGERRRIEEIRRAENEERRGRERMRKDPFARLMRMREQNPRLMEWRHRLRVYEELLMMNHEQGDHIERIFRSEQRRVEDDAKAIERYKRITGVTTLLDIDWPPGMEGGRRERRRERERMREEESELESDSMSEEEWERRRNRYRSPPPPYCANRSPSRENRRDGGNGRKGTQAV